MESGSADSRLLKLSIGMIGISIVIGAVNLGYVILRNDGIPGTLPIYPLVATEISSQAQMDLWDLISENDRTVIWVIRLKCPACETALRESVIGLQEVQRAGYPVVVLVDDYSDELFSEKMSVLPQDLRYFDLPLNLTDVLGFRVSPACYLLDSEGAILNKRAQYPGAWSDIQGELGERISNARSVAR